MKELTKLFWFILPGIGIWTIKTSVCTHKALKLRVLWWTLTLLRWKEQN